MSLVHAILLGGLGCRAAPQLSHEAPLVHVARLQNVEGSSVFRVTGDLHARVESHLAFQTGGKVVARAVDVGDHVAAGAFLARLDSLQEQADVAIAKATLGSASAALTHANLELERERHLFSDGATTHEKLDDAQRDQVTAQSMVLSVAARLDLARTMLSYTELRARHAGTISARTVDVGQVVQAGVPVYTVNEDGPRDAVFRVDEMHANRLEARAPLAISLIDDPTIHALGAIREVAPEVDVGTATVRIKVAIEDAPPQMSLGAPVVANLKLATTRTFVIPVDALFSDAEEATAVWVVDVPTKTVTLRRVVVASYEVASVVVREGLADGDVIVTAGASHLRPSEIVRFDIAGPV